MYGLLFATLVAISHTNHNFFSQPRERVSFGCYYDVSQGRPLFGEFHSASDGSGERQWESLSRRAVNRLIRRSSERKARQLRRVRRLCGRFVPQGVTPTLPSLTLTPVLDGLTKPIYLTHRGDRTGTLYVVEQDGRVVLFDPSSGQREVVLDITAKTVGRGERGLLSIAFHPKQKNRVFAYYTDLENNTVVSEFRRLSSGQIDSASERVLLQVEQPFRNHNGGLLKFGPDGYLYIGLGDGGSGGDPHGNGQNLETLLGKILRIDVSTRRGYAIPRSNPFRNRREARAEIWAYGLRNPWRFSFDRLTDRLFVGDVGQNRLEEVDIIQKGRNYGWNVMEGSQCFNPEEGCDQTGLELPLAEYGRDEGASITGGYVYRGRLIPELFGRYIFADFMTGEFWVLSPTDSGGWQRDLVLETDFFISSFGEAQDGTVYALDYGGSVYRIDSTGN